MFKKISFIIMVICALFLAGNLDARAETVPGNITVNKSYDGQVTGSDTVKQYNFTLSGAGKVNITFSHANISNTSECWDIKIFNQNQDSLLEMGSTGIELNKTSADLGLPAGKYYVQIHGWNDSTYNIVYNFKVNFEAADCWEKEENDGYGTATGISVNKEYKGANQSVSDRDYYKFSLNTAGRVKINFQHPVLQDNNRYWDVYLRSENSEELLRMETTGAESSSSSAEIGLPAGVYYIEISMYYFSDETYCFNVDYSVSNYWESEFNGGFADADSVSLNTNYSGANQFGSDDDYYRFTLNSSGKISIDFSHPFLDEANPCWRIYVYEEHAEELLFFEVKGTERKVTSAELGLPAGDYYLLVDAFYFNSATYTFKINYVKSNKWETEKNDGYAAADTITVGTPYFGAIQRYEDVDYYRFSLGNKKDIEINFKHLNLKDSSTYWRVRMYNSKAEEITSFLVSGIATNITTQTFTLGAGTYYVSVERYSSFDASTYTVTVNYAKPMEKPILKASSISGCKVKLSWSQCTKANGYEISRSSSKDGYYYEVKEIPNKSVLTFTDSDLSVGRVYYYKVRPYLDVAGERSYGSYSTAVKVKILPSKAVLRKVTAGTKKATIVWKKQSDVSGYQIYMSAKKNGSYKKIKTISDAATVKYVKKGLKKKKQYYFKVRSFYYVDGKNVYGSFSNPKAVRVR